MPQYKSFQEYLKVNFLDVMQKSFKKFILKEMNEETNNLYNFRIAIINNFEIIGVKFTKSELEKVEFDVFLSVEYVVGYGDKNPVFKSGTHHLFSCHFKGGFREGFVLSKKKIEKINRRPFLERITKNLVHVIDKEKMELYATKFLKYYCPEALKRPMPLDLTKILNDKGVTWRSAPLTSGVFGKIYFADDIAEVYGKNQKPETVEIKRGTILINTIKANERGDGALRNTIVHEAVHWFYHNNYFGLRHLLNNELTCAVCYKSDHQIGDEDIKWMESQARSLAPKILLPKKMFLRKFKEEFKRQKKIAKGLEQLIGMQRESDILQNTIYALAKFFEVSKLSVKYRLIELGFVAADGVINYNCEARRYYSTYQFNVDKLADHQTFHISKESYLSLIEQDETIAHAIRERQLIYTNGLLVINHPKYFENDKLTQYAINNVDECCIIVNVKSDSKPFKDYIAKFTLCSGGSSKVEAQINEEQLAFLLGQMDENIKHFEKNKKDLPSDVGDLVEWHINKKDVSYEWVAEHCDLTAVTVRKLRSGKIDDMKPITFIKFAIGMRLSYPYARDLLNKAGINIERVSKQNGVLITLISSFPRLGLAKSYKVLKINNQENYLKLTKRYINKYVLQKTR